MLRSRMIFDGTSGNRPSRRFEKPSCTAARKHQRAAGGTPRHYLPGYLFHRSRTRQNGVPLVVLTPRTRPAGWAPSGEAPKVMQPRFGGAHRQTRLLVQKRAITKRYAVEKCEPGAAYGPLRNEANRPAMYSKFNPGMPKPDSIHRVCDRGAGPGFRQQAGYPVTAQRRASLSDWPA